MNYQNTYTERINSNDKASDMFEQMLKANGLKYHKLGIRGEYTMFWKLPTLIKKLPDFIIDNYIAGCNGFIEVKGTNKLKLEDLNAYNRFASLLEGTDNLFLVCFVIGDKFIYRTIPELNEYWIKHLQYIKTYTDNGKEYMEVDLYEKR